jgi:hypothetical protein
VLKGARYFTISSRQIQANAAHTLMICFTEQVSVVVTLYTCIRELLDSNLGRDTGYYDYRGFPQFLQASAWILPRLDHDSFLASPFKFVIHQLSYNSMFYTVF